MGYGSGTQGTEHGVMAHALGDWRELGHGARPEGSGPGTGMEGEKCVSLASHWSLGEGEGESPRL